MWTTSILRGVMSGLLLGGLARAQSCNTPTNRACWTSNFNIDTDYETSTPTTGVTRSYTFTLTEVDNWVAGDGSVKTKAMLVNGQFPGPTITANWGDEISVNVINNLRTNGTSIHWHGIRQLNNNINDGANGVTECPIPPGHSKTYTFLAQQYGTSWYHSHFSTQYANGVTGSIVINGPASLNYDIDLGAYPISDWYHGDAGTLELQSQLNGGAPPPSNNILFNGTNINPSGTGGQYSKVVLTPGKRHLLRLINPSVENTYVVSLVGHDFTVIEADFVPVDAFTTPSVYLGIGQRLAVTIDASQAVGNYWLNVSFSNTFGCGSSDNPAPAAIFSYVGANNSLPTNPGTVPPDSLCSDTTNLVPVVSRTAPLTAFNALSDDFFVSLETNATTSLTNWQVNGSSIKVDWGNPTLLQVQNGDKTFLTSENLVSVPQANIWSVWLIQNLTPIPHPMHLHGHDFLILGKSTFLTCPFCAGNAPRPFNASTDIKSLNLNNPTRRDVTMLPGFGWLVVAFHTDNPGAWLFHCHIAWHVAQGLSVQYLEQEQNIASSQNLAALQPNCNNWNAYYPSSDPFKQTDSGLKERAPGIAWTA
ncbi:multicopper oxidase [Hyaloscypha variabilis]